MNEQYTISNIVDHLKQIRGMSALVLGGSRARGTESPNSDIDIGIYYDSEKGLDISQLRRVAAELDDDHRENLVTEIGGWGPWINGGGWLEVNQIPVDFLFRDQNKVSHVIEECVMGNITMDYQPGHPHGFANSIYLAEIALCKVLWDPSDLVGKLKSRTTPFSPVFQEATIQNFFWEATFALDNGYKGIYKKDLSYIAGCCFRSVSCLNQVLFAINETYLMNEKGAAAIADSFSIVPSKYAQRINEIFTFITEDQECLKKAINMIRELIQETENLMKTKS
ncbi:nucleotidyltransferase domain-containing protein [Paenibacillus sp. FSL H7-0331]|uniref:nucleotidyltransferase domain-containing protein n=1 Tax=Paenibacillus sp. FSL H7-0331 TaxID=1920421 RepID=UPI00096C905D|nr:nucleotidyltransferase domain-containing protein [Paenibacillus sp. FSL H7-0331]OME97359.1 DNA polymerase subunit beta [Paenibacillus sp. FSL H7-0331]